MTIIHFSMHLPSLTDRTLAYLKGENIIPLLRSIKRRPNPAVPAEVFESLLLEFQAYFKSRGISPGERQEPRIAYEDFSFHYDVCFEMVKRRFTDKERGQVLQAVNDYLLTITHD